MLLESSVISATNELLFQLPKEIDSKQAQESAGNPQATHSKAIEFVKTSHDYEPRYRKDGEGGPY